jgi:hypothetical protein
MTRRLWFAALLVLAPLGGCGTPPEDDDSIERVTQRIAFGDIEYRCGDEKCVCDGKKTSRDCKAMKARECQGPLTTIHEPSDGQDYSICERKKGPDCTHDTCQTNFACCFT